MTCVRRHGLFLSVESRVWHFGFKRFFFGNCWKLNKKSLLNQMRKDTFAELKFISIFPNDKHIKYDYVLIQIGHSDMIYFCCPKANASCKLAISWTYSTKVVVNILIFSWPGCFLLWHKLFKPYKTSPAVLRVSDIMHSVRKSYKLQCVDLENENWEVRRILVSSKHLFQLIHFYLSPLNHNYSLLLKILFCN